MELSVALPMLQFIAWHNGLCLNNAKDYKVAVFIYKTMLN